MIKRIVAKEVKKVNVDFKKNVLNYLAETIANSAKVFTDNEIGIDDINSLPVEVKVIKTQREPVLVFDVSGVQVKAAISIPKTEVTGEVIAIATQNDDESIDESTENDLPDTELETVSE